MSVTVRERLGDEASHAIEDYIAAERRTVKDEVMELAGQRFEQRLTSEVSALRVEMHKGFTEIWQAMSDLRVAVRQELSENRVELLRWSFVFWIGQVIAMASLLAFMLRQP
jgi:hypothetical protein